MLCVRCNQDTGLSEVLTGALEVVTSHFDVTESELFGRRRTARIAVARHVLMWLLRHRGLSFPEIGQLVGRDHSTVMYGVSQAEHRLGFWSLYPLLEEMAS